MDDPKNVPSSEQQKSAENMAESSRDFGTEVKRLKEKIQQEFKDLSAETQADIERIERELEDLGQDNFVISDAGLARLEEIKKEIADLEREFSDVRAEIMPEPKIETSIDAKPEKKENRDGILAQLKAGLEILKSLPEAEQTARIKWVINSVETAIKKSIANPDLTFVVSADGQSQQEGIPVDDLIEELSRLASEKKTTVDKLAERKKGLVSMRKLAADLKKKYEETLKRFGRDQGAGTDQEHQEKNAWHSVYNELPTSKQTLRGKLRQWVDATRKSWAKADSEAGNSSGINQEGDDYIVDSENFPMQTGEALRQVTEKIIADGAGEFDEAEFAKLKKELKKIEGIIATLEANSKKYFDIRPQMEGEAQHWRTELEAKLISLDLRSTGDVNKDYELAMAAMNKRREIVLVPEEPPIEDPKIKPIKPPLQIEHDPKSAGELEIIKPKRPPQKPQLQIEHDPRSAGELEIIPPKEIIKKPDVDPKKRDKIYIVDMSEVVKALAWREAEQKLRAIQDEGNSSFLKRAFVRLGEKGYLVKYYQEALQAIQSNKNLMAEIETRVLSKSLVKSEHQDKSYKLLDSVLEEFTKEVVDADEKGDLVQDDEVNLVIGQLFADYATSSMTRKDFDQAVQDRVVASLKVKNKKFTKTAGREREAEGLMYANNLFALAEGYRQQVEKQTKELGEKFGPEQLKNIERHIKSVISGLDIQLGLKQKDLYETKPKPVLKWYEKFVDMTENIPVLNKVIANPVAYGVLGGIVGSLAGKGIARVAAGAGLVAIAGTAPWLTPLLVAGGLGGTFTAMRRSRDLQYDRGMDLRRTTLGVEVDADAKRTKKIREFKYDLKRAEDLEVMLTSLMSKANLTDSEKQDVAGVIARIEVEKEKSVDLIGVPEAEGEEFKTKLIAMKDLKVTLKDLESKFGLSRDEAEMRKLIDGVKVDLIKNIESNDKNFDAYRRQQMIKSGLIGAGLGLVAGAVGQWGFGEVKSMLGYTPKTESALEHLAHYINGERGTAGSGGMERLIAKGGELFDQNGNTVIDGLSFDPKTGKLDPAVIAELKAQGVVVNEKYSQISEVSSVASNLQEGLAKHPRADWHDEPGKRLSSFFNRLIEHEGKQQMFYLNKDASGNVVVDASKILENLSANAKSALKEFGTNPDGSVDSKLAGLKSQLEEWASKGELAKHIKVAIFPTDADNKAGLSYLTDSADGSGKINLGDNISKLFSAKNSMQDGHIPFRFGELRIIDNDGASHVLATISGKDIDPGITTGSSSENFVYTFDMLVKPPVDPGWDVPPVLPFDPRRPLEGPRKKDEVGGVDNDENSGSGGGESGRSVINKFKSGIEEENKSGTYSIIEKEKKKKTTNEIEEENANDNVTRVEVEDEEEEEVARLSFEELLKEIPLKRSELWIAEKETAREWLMDLSLEELQELSVRPENVKNLRKLVELSYFDKDVKDFQDRIAETNFNKLWKRMNKILPRDSELRRIFDRPIIEVGFTPVE